MVPFHLLLMVVNLISVIIAISSANFVSIWIALEVNTIVLAPFVRRIALPSYLLVQRLGSAFIIIGAVVSNNYLILFGAFIKGGLAPFHMWVPRVIRSINYYISLMLITTQKIAPLCVISRIYRYHVCVAVSAMSCILGRIGALKRRQIREVLAFSSVVHIGWVVASLRLSVNTAFYYFLIYRLTCVPVLVKLGISNPKSPVRGDLSFIIYFISISGVPPLVRFIPKVLILFNCPTVL